MLSVMLLALSAEETLIEITKDTEDKIYFCVIENGAFFFISVNDGWIRRLEPNGKVKVFQFSNCYRKRNLSSEAKNVFKMVNSYISNETLEEREERIAKAIVAWMEKEPMLYSLLSNVKSFGNELVFLHNDLVRSVQFVDKNMKVLKTCNHFSNDVAYSWWPPASSHFRVPFCVDKKRNITSIGGERGELLKWDQDGKILKRLVVKGIFNESRIEKPGEPDELTKALLASDNPNKRAEGEHMLSFLKYSADNANVCIAARDKLLPSPIFIKGDQFPQSIKAMESRDNGNIIILDGEMTDKEREKVKKGEMEYRYQKLYELNPETAEIKLLQIPGFKLLREDIQLKEEKGDKISQDEIIIDIRCKNDILCILTRYRALTVEFEPELRVTGEYHFRFDDEKYNNIPWDVTCTKPVKFLVVNLEERRIDEYQPLPEKVGTPLDTGVAEEKRREEAEEAEEIRVLEEFEKRHTAEKKITPVLEADKEAARRLVDLFHKRVIAGEFDKIPDMLHNDFVSEMITTKKTYVEEVVPQMYSDIKKIGVIAEIKSKIGESFYTDDTRSIIKSQVELILIDKDGKVRESEKGKVIFYFYFIKTKNGMQILEMDIKDRTERFKKDETEDTTEVE